MCSKDMTWAGGIDCFFPPLFMAELYQFRSLNRVYRSNVTECIKFHSVELPSRVLLDAAVQQVMMEHSYAQLPLSKR